MKKHLPEVTLMAAALLLCNSARTLQAQPAAAGPISLLSQLPTAQKMVASTVPHNGDLNPYGVAFVPDGFPGGGVLQPGDILVANFNDSANLQGTGSTIVRVTPAGVVSLFFQSTKPVGLTTALTVLKSGFIVVGNLPTTDGTSNTVRKGSLLIIDRFGSLVATFSSVSLLDGPWDLTSHEEGLTTQLFISCVLNGTITRFVIQGHADGQAPIFISETEIAAGYLHRFDPAALVIGPTGLAYDPDSDTLFVASTGDNAIYSVADAKTRTSVAQKGTLVYSDNAHLHGPLGLVMAKSGHLITSNGDAINPGGMQNLLIEFTQTGHFVAEYQLDPGTAGGAFGMALRKLPGATWFAAVDDVNNTLIVWFVN